MEMTDFNKSRPAQNGNRLWVAPTAVVIGDVEMGENCKVLFNSVIRGESSRVIIGDHSVVLENCFIKSLPSNDVVLGSRVTVGHRTVLEGCTIHDDAVLGDEVKVLEGALIGRGSVVQPGTVVFKNTVVPPYTMFSGIPGHPSRELTEEEIKEMKKKWVTFENQWQTKNDGIG